MSSKCQTTGWQRVTGSLVTTLSITFQSGVMLCLAMRSYSCRTASMLCLGPGALLSARLVAVALAMALSLDRSSGLNRLQIRIIQDRELVYNETISPEKPGKSGIHTLPRAAKAAGPPLAEAEGRSGIHIAAVDRDGLPGDEIAVGRSQENQRAQEVLGMLVPPRTGLDRAVAGGLDVARILAHHGVAQVKPGASVLTRMPCSPSSRASARVIAMMPPLVVT